jgi:hypothetical protein
MGSVHIRNPLCCNSQVFLAMGEADNAGDDIDKASEQAENLPGALAVGIIGCIIGLGVGIFYMLALRKLVKDLLGTVRSPCFCVPYEKKSVEPYSAPPSPPLSPPTAEYTVHAPPVVKVDNMEALAPAP